VRHPVQADPGQIRFEVVKSKISGAGTYFRDQMKPKFGGGFEDHSGRGPSVAAESAAGENRVIAVTKKLQEAKDKAVVVENDF
jgi:hypothetical protein